MADTYTLIEKIAVGAAGASSVTFTSIPQTYTDLCIVISARSNRATNADDLMFRFNGNSSNIYSYRQLYGFSGGAGSVSNTLTRQPIGQMPAANSTVSTFSNDSVYIPNYTGSANKSVSIDNVWESNSSTVWQLNLFAGLWSNTSAITSIELFSDSSSNIVQYSTFYLYGIAKEGVNPAPSSAPYATGGDRILYDGTYWYHAFTSTGTFTPKKGLSCDVLVVAGGGGGSGGGGGAGGVIAFATQSLTTTGYTVTIGAGGAGKALSGGFTNGNNGSNSQFGSLTAAVGGGGGGGYNGQQGSSGGSGGGNGQTSGTGASSPGGSGTSGQGNAGGSVTTSYTGSPYPGAGGGGYGAAGNSPTSNSVAGAGGSGSNTVTNWGALSTTLTTTGLGVSGYIAGGGGGGLYSTGGTGGSAGSGGGGVGASGSGTATSATVNTGSGGGGAGDSGTSGAGGSGIVIVRYAA